MVKPWLRQQSTKHSEEVKNNDAPLLLCSFHTFFLFMSLTSSLPPSPPLPPSLPLSPSLHSSLSPPSPSTPPSLPPPPSLPLSVSESLVMNTHVTAAEWMIQLERVEEMKFGVQVWMRWTSPGNIHHQIRSGWIQAGLGTTFLCHLVNKGIGPLFTSGYIHLIK